MQTTKHSSLTDGCEFHTFNFKRQAQVLDFNLPFDRVENGQCVYATSEVINKLETAVYGERIRKAANYAYQGFFIPLKKLCDESDSFNALPPNCPQTASCRIKVPEGDENIYAFGIEKDSCGNIIAEENNGGEKI